MGGDAARNHIAYFDPMRHIHIHHSVLLHVPKISGSLYGPLQGSRRTWSIHGSRTTVTPSHSIILPLRAAAKDSMIDSFDTGEI